MWASLQSSIDSWGLWAVAAVLFLEGMGAPLPVEIAFLGVGALIRTKSVAPWHAVLVCWGSALAGNLVGYSVAVAGGRRLLYRSLRLLRVRRERLERLEQWVREHGMAALLVTRLTHWGFAPVLWLAGIMRMPRWRLVTVMVVGDLAWVSLWVFLGTGVLSANPLHVTLALAGIALIAVFIRRWLGSKMER